jgi:hypothetical protein
MNKKFWNALFESYPQAVQEFYDFIDQYKIDNKWEELFRKGIKFHDIPIELQLGVWISFLNEQGCGNSDDINLGIDCFEQENIWEWTSEWFRNREIDINISSSK